MKVHFDRAAWGLPGITVGSCAGSFQRPALPGMRQNDLAVSDCSSTTRRACEALCYSQSPVKRSALLRRSTNPFKLRPRFLLALLVTIPCGTTPPPILQMLTRRTRLHYCTIPACMRLLLPHMSERIHLPRQHVALKTDIFMWCCAGGQWAGQVARNVREVRKHMHRIEGSKQQPGRQAAGSNQAGSFTRGFIFFMKRVHPLLRDEFLWLTTKASILNCFIKFFTEAPRRFQLSIYPQRIDTWTST